MCARSGAIYGLGSNRVANVWLFGEVWSAEERTVVIGEGFDKCVGGRWLSRAADSEDQTEVGVAGVPEELVPETGGLSDGDDCKNSVSEWFGIWTAIGITRGKKDDDEPSPEEGSALIVVGRVEGWS